ncbi:MAG: RelA/SpoT family protein [Fimbriimonadaceae bacterium]|nr:RelA/SpoT family protein [Fimbriimonadaceae bacterium]
MAEPVSSSDPAHRLELMRLLETVKGSRQDAKLDLIEKAYWVADEAHSGQVRKSGERYVVHPTEVALIVAELRMDDDSIIAALLHDVLEDTEYSRDKMQSLFGPDVVRLVEAVTKLKLNISPEASATQKATAETVRAAETLRKMLLAMAQDFRVMVIKLADRLHNMRTIHALRPEKQTRIANETLEVYAPLAARLGIWQLKWQLEDLAFQVLHPDEYHRTNELVAAGREQREHELIKATEQLKARLDAAGITGYRIMARPKHLYSIFNKIVKQKVPFEEIYDLIAMRVILEEHYQCYVVLAIVHELFIPIQGLFSDYIARPKPNGYQSLHTKVMGPDGDALEIQIRTKAMHAVAEFGVAAHWTYKEGSSAKGVDKLQVLRQQLLDFSSDNLASSDFLRSVSTDLFTEQVFAFTPKGDVIDMPVGSTAVDFAFRVHTNLGLQLVGVKVNGTIATLNTKIQNGDVVDLMTRSNAQPSLDWLEFVKSQHTRSKLRNYFRKRNRDENERAGRSVLEKELRSIGLDPRIYLGEDRMAEIVKQIKDVSNVSDVCARVGEGLVSVSSVVDKIRSTVKEVAPEQLQIPKARKVESTVIRGGIDNVMLRRAKCCLPIPDQLSCLQWFKLCHTGLGTLVKATTSLISAIRSSSSAVCTMPCGVNQYQCQSMPATTSQSLTLCVLRSNLHQFTAPCSPEAPLACQNHVLLLL